MISKERFLQVLHLGMDRFIDHMNKKDMETEEGCFSQEDEKVLDKFYTYVESILVKEITEEVSQ